MIQDTRETNIHNTINKNYTKCRFKIGDKVLIPHNGAIVEQTIRNIFWDKSFGGWMVICHMIGIHEQNYIHTHERDEWKAHEDGLWSWWIKK